MDAGSLQAALEAGLRTSWLGRVLHVAATTGSTNDDAKRLGDDGAPHGTAVIALAQTAGRGRRGRSWTDLGGHHVFLSLLLRPTGPVERLPELPLVVGLGVADALEALGLQPDLKWPNDVEIGGRKVGGILCELTTHLDGSPAYVVAGLGLNVDAPTADVPPDIAERFTSLALAGRSVGLPELYDTLFPALEARLDRHAAGGFAALHGDYERRLGLMHQRVRAHVGHALEGLCIGVSETGELLVREDDGALERVASGEVERVRKT